LSELHAGVTLDGCMQVSTLVTTYWLYTGGTLITHYSLYAEAALITTYWLYAGGALGTYLPTGHANYCAFVSCWHAIIFGKLESTHLHAALTDRTHE
jgi:hypothetical protein